MSKRKRRQRRSGCGALFAALGTLITSFAALIGAIVKGSVAALRWLDSKKLPRPIRERLSTSQLRILVVIIVISSCGFLSCLFVCGMSNAALRGVGILPTYTPPPTKTPTPTATPTSISTNTPRPANTPVPTQTSVCTRIRFGELLVDDTDDLYNEGRQFSDVSEIGARFDCREVSYDQVSFEWYRDGEFYCSYGKYSSLTTWTGGKFLISVWSKDGRLVSDLLPGEYRLVVYVDGEEATSGIIRIR